MDMGAPTAGTEPAWLIVRHHVRSQQAVGLALKARVEAATSRARALVDESRRARELRGRSSGWLNPSKDTALALQSLWSRDLRAGFRRHVILEEARGVLKSRDRHDTSTGGSPRDRAVRSFVTEWQPGTGEVTRYDDKPRASGA